MKKIGLSLIFLLLPVIISAQDRLIKTDNTLLTVKIFEIGEDVIKYKPFSNQDGPMFSISVTNVHKIILENGDEFEFTPVINNTEPTSENSTSTLQIQIQESAAEQAENKVNANSVREADFENRNFLNTKKTVGTAFNVDITNTENYGSEDSEEYEALFLDIISVNIFTPLADSHKDDDPDASHGIIAAVTAKAAMIFPGSLSNVLSIETYVVDIGLGYQYNIKQELFLYGTLNTIMYVNSSTSFYDDTPDMSFEDSFPKDSGNLRLGAYWTPIKINKVNRFGIHTGLQMPFAEGAENSFYLGLAFR